MNNIIDIKSLTFTQLTQCLEGMGLPAFRAKQIFGWLHQKHVNHFNDMRNLPVSLRNQLQEQFSISNVKIEKVFHSSLDSTRKYLFRLDDNEVVEGVLMKYHHGNSLCISSQVGCNMGCSFCASTIGGKVRNLLPSEMLAQIELAEAESGEPVSSIVMMGIGEPLENYTSLLSFLDILSDKNGRNLSLRHVTVSTCGLVDKILLLAQQKLQITLSVSLHAPNDILRSQLMPVNKKYPIAELISACKEYFFKTGRRISFEYALIDQVNNSDACARQLVQLLHGFNCHVNLIAVNPVKERSYRAGSVNSIQRFEQLLSQGGLQVTHRRTLGEDIQAACGQLRREHTGNKV